MLFTAGGLASWLWHILVGLVCGSGAYGCAGPSPEPQPDPFVVFALCMVVFMLLAAVYYLIKAALKK